jgi:hypothetical protein
MKNIIFLLISLFLLASCSSLKEAGKVMRNEKVSTTDEFLVKKRNPLVLPPNYEEIPEPGSISQKKEESEDKIKKILNASKSKETSSKKHSSVEDSILNRIRK